MFSTNLTLMKKYFSLMLLIFCSHVAMQAQETSPDFDQLVDWMTGEFDSAEQSKSDTSYMNISLKMTRIWPDAPTGAWLYVEQSLASTPSKPYRQRVYFISEINDYDFSSDVYMIPNEKDFVGAWKNPELFKGMTAFDLKYKDGCAVYLTYDGFQYAGQTNEGTCKSDFQGADYASSIVTVLPNEIRSWDRGFDSEGKYMWGAEKGPYIFKKR